MLGIYTQEFGNSNKVLKQFEIVGLACIKTSFFFGFATGVMGKVQK